jgi:hypothetical protein
MTSFGHHDGKMSTLVYCHAQMWAVTQMARGGGDAGTVQRSNALRYHVVRPAEGDGTHVWSAEGR